MAEIKIGQRVLMTSTVDGRVEIGTVTWVGEHMAAVWFDGAPRPYRAEKSWFRPVGQK